MDKKIFSFRELDKLSFKERFYQNLIVVGLPFILLGVFIPISDLGWEIELPLSLVGGGIISISLALVEHAFFKARKPKSPSQNSK